MTENKQMTTEAELKAELEKLKRENDLLKQTPKAVGKISIKLSEKGTGVISLYGLGRYPVSLYEEQWNRLLETETVKAVRDYIAECHAKNLFPSKEEMEANKAAVKQRTKEDLERRAAEQAEG